MAELAVRKPVTKKVAEEIAVVDLNWFTNKNGTWCAETDMGWVVASGKLTEEQLDDAIASGDVTYTTDEDEKTTFFVGYNMTRKYHTSSVKKFVAKQSTPVERNIAKLSKVFEEYAIE